VSSFFFTALPRFWAASTSSAARRSRIVFSPRCASRVHEPAHGEGDAALGAHLDGDLVGRAADAPALHLELGLDVVEGLAEDLDGLFLEAVLDDVERAVEDALGRRLLAAKHDRVRELRDELVLELGVRDDPALRDFAATGHVSSRSLLGVEVRRVLGSFSAISGLGRLTPYLERLRLRVALLVELGPEAPDASRVPRTTW
jgi:hypothetical protein